VFVSVNWRHFAALRLMKLGSSTENIILFVLRSVVFCNSYDTINNIVNLDNVSFLKLSRCPEIVSKR
jgi:hypothetical protein